MRLLKIETKHDSQSTVWRLYDISASGEWADSALHPPYKSRFQGQVLPTPTPMPTFLCQLNQGPKILILEL